ncbi:MAG: hypothetical protein WDN48_18020 [Pseudolabrys sp.]
MARQKSIFGKIGDSIKVGGAAVADVAQAAITASSDLPDGGGYRQVKNQRWAQEIEATGAKKSTAKKSKKKVVKRAAKKTSKKTKKKRL